MATLIGRNVAKFLLSNSKATPKKVVEQWNGKGHSWSSLVSTCRPDEIPKDKPFVIRSPSEDLLLPDATPFTNHVMDKFGQYGDKIALVDGSTGRQWSYAQLQTAISRVGSALAKQGFKKGDLATIFSPNCPEFAILYLGLASLGAVVSAVNPVYTPDELLHALDHSNSKLVATVPSLLKVTKQAVAKSKCCKEIVVFGEGEDCRPFSSLLEDDGSQFPTSLDIDVKGDLLALPYSSGTTGLPKGVMLTHHNVTSNIEQLRCKDAADYNDEDVFIGVLPFFHIYGQVVVLFSGLKVGAKTVSVPSFDPAQYLKLCQEHKATLLHVAPPLALFLSQHPMVSSFDLSSVHSMVSGAAPLSHEVAAACCDKLGFSNFRQGYGLTETSPVTHLAPPNKDHYAAIGFPIPNTQCKITDTNTGETLGIDQEGEVCIKGPQVMKGYLNNQKATGETVDKDGWLHTGDIGIIREDGQLQIVDRLKELIKYKGLQVAPAELEKLLLTHPGVKDSAVIGIPDERAGELPRGYVVLKDGHRLTEEELHQYILGKVAPYKQLAGGIEFRDQIPKSASGKILRRLLKEEYVSNRRS